MCHDSTLLEELFLYFLVPGNLLYILSEITYTCDNLLYNSFPNIKQNIGV